MEIRDFFIYKDDGGIRIDDEESLNRLMTYQSSILASMVNRVFSCSSTLSLRILDYPEIPEQVFSNYGDAVVFFLDWVREKPWVRRFNSLHITSDSIFVSFFDDTNHYGENMASISE